MLLEIEKSAIIQLLSKQLSNLFAFDPKTENEPLILAINNGLERCEQCFSQNGKKGYVRNGVPVFNPWHSGQYCIFLYFVSNALSSAGNGSLADRVYYLNKTLNGLDLFHAVEMPACFMLDHPVGSVIGKASYGNNFAFTQNCTVGNNRSIYPRIGANVKMLSGSKILGDCEIGDHVIFSANSYVKDMKIPACSLVFGQFPNNTIKSRDLAYFLSDEVAALI